jgi:hypothetical protein
LLGAISVALAGMALLEAIWIKRSAVFSLRHQDFDYFSAGPRILVAGFLMLCGGIGACFEFDSDPPPKKDPWDQ